MHPTPPTLSILNTHFKDLDQGYTPQVIPHENGEMILELHERVRNALSAVIKQLDEDPEGPKTLLICTHAAVMIAAGRVLTGKMPDDLDEDDFQCYTASLSTFRRMEGERARREAVGVWECVGNAEAGFLKGGGERGWCVSSSVKPLHEERDSNQ